MLRLDITADVCKFENDFTVAELVSLIKLNEINKELKLKLHKCITCEHMIKKNIKNASNANII